MESKEDELYKKTIETLSKKLYCEYKVCKHYHSPTQCEYMSRIGHKLFRSQLPSGDDFALIFLLTIKEDCKEEKLNVEATITLYRVANNVYDSDDGSVSENVICDYKNSTNRYIKYLKRIDTPLLKTLSSRINWGSYSDVLKNTQTLFDKKVMETWNNACVCVLCSNVFYTNSENTKYCWACKFNELHLEKEYKESECTICYENISYLSSVSICGIKEHSIDRECYKRMLEVTPHNIRCPVCRGD